MIIFEKVKKDYLFIPDFHLYHIIIDENIGNTICGYIPFPERYYYVNIFTRSFTQLYDLLQTSKGITESILLEMAERLSSEEERPFIIDAESLGNTPYIALHTGLCLRESPENIDELGDDMGNLLLDRFFPIPENNYHFPDGFLEFSDELLKLACRYDHYLVLLETGCDEQEAKCYFDFDDEIIFSLAQKCKHQFSNLNLEENIDWSKIKISFVNIENLSTKNIPRKFSVLLTVTGFDDLGESKAIRANFFSGEIDLYPSEWVQRYLKMGYWFNPSIELQKHTLACLKQMPATELKPLLSLISNPTGK